MSRYCRPIVLESARMYRPGLGLPLVGLRTERHRYKAHSDILRTATNPVSHWTTFLLHQHPNLLRLSKMYNLMLARRKVSSLVLFN